MSDPLDAFPEFAARVRLRLEHGSRDYGERSFSRPLPELVREIREELLDVCGWSYVMWTRLDGLERACRAVEAKSPSVDTDPDWMDFLLSFEKETERT